jgi:hypothetical protein
MGGGRTLAPSDGALLLPNRGPPPSEPRTFIPAVLPILLQCVAMEHAPITFALLDTWTCHGQWLPGDPRGYVSNTLTEHEDYRPKHNKPGTPYDRGDARTFDGRRAGAKHAMMRIGGNRPITPPRASAWRILARSPSTTGVRHAQVNICRLCVARGCGALDRRRVWLCGHALDAGPAAAFATGSRQTYSP